jgi:putative lipoic acid-binding regulatory protein
MTQTDGADKLLEFPCTFPIKAIGKNIADFEDYVVAIARKHISQLDASNISSRPSNGDKYLGVTITFTAESQEQLDALYQELSDSDRVLMLL